MVTENRSEQAFLKFKEDGESHDESAARVADKSAEGDKPLNDLQKELLKKFAAESTFIRGPQTQKVLAETQLISGAQTRKTTAEATFIAGSQTRKTDAETLFLEVRKLEAEAEIERLKVERLRLEAEVHRTDAERSERKANTVHTYGSMIGKTVLFLVVLIVFLRFTPY